MTLIERVARAIYDAADKQGAYVGDYRFGLTGEPWTCLDGDFDLDAIARAAIAAMREPTEAMEKAMEKSDFEGWSPEPGEGRDYLSLTTAWEAAIDAALAEKPDEHGPPRA